MKYYQISFFWKLQGQAEGDEIANPDSDCENIRLPKIIEREEIKNSDQDVTGYRFMFEVYDGNVLPTWHRFHEIPELNSREFNYPLHGKFQLCNL